MFQDLINEWIKHMIVPHWKSKNKFSIEIIKYCKNCKIENRMDSKLIMYLYRCRTVKYVLSTPSFVIVHINLLVSFQENTLYILSVITLNTKLLPFRFIFSILLTLV